MLPDEFRLAFPSKKNQAKAKHLVHLLSTIDYVPDQCDKMVSSFQALVETPYETPEMIEKEAFHKVEEGFWELYDKSKYVSDIEQIQRVRVKQKLGSEAINKQLAMLKSRYVEARDFDTRCILAIELACCGQEDGVDYLGERGRTVFSLPGRSLGTVAPQGAGRSLWLLNLFRDSGQPIRPGTPHCGRTVSETPLRQSR